MAKKKNPCKLQNGLPETLKKKIIINNKKKLIPKCVFCRGKGNFILKTKFGFKNKPRAVSQKGADSLQIRRMNCCLAFS